MISQLRLPQKNTRPRNILVQDHVCKQFLGIVQWRLNFVSGMMTFFVGFVLRQNGYDSRALWEKTLERNFGKRLFRTSSCGFNLNCDLTVTILKKLAI